jgi:hypothetical protein
MKASIFIGSSREGLAYAKSIQTQLSDAYEVTVWNEGLFLLGKTILKELLTFRCRFDFAILVLTPDDVIVCRGDQTNSPRDNVLFELGIFISSLGPERTFVVTTKDDIKLPSDLDGLIVAKIDRSDSNVEATVDDACSKIRAAVAAAYSKSTLGLLPSTALAIGYYNDFVKKVCRAFSDPDSKLTLKGEQGQPDEAIDIKRTKVRLIVVIPDNFWGFEHEGIEWFRKQLPGMRLVELKATSRTFPFYVCQREGAPNEIEFFDIPTTLSTSKKAIEQIFGPVIGEDKMLDQIERREIGNFKQTVERLSKRERSSGLLRIEPLAYLGL